jgi:hypothetical protein
MKRKVKQNILKDLVLKSIQVLAGDSERGNFLQQKKLKFEMYIKSLEHIMVCGFLIKYLKENHENFCLIRD